MNTCSEDTRVHSLLPKKTTFYLAADFARQAEMRDVRRRLAESGYRVTARWLDVDETPQQDAAMIGGVASAGDHLRLAECAYMDLNDLRAADVFVQFTTGERARGGRHVELGAALAWHKRVAVVGPLEHVFHYSSAVSVRAADLDAFLRWATRLA